jgi:hypothetical protein
MQAEKENIMTTTSKNITLAPSIDAVAFTFTPAAYAAADAWHKAGNTEVKAAVAFYDMLIAHGVDPVLLRKPEGRAFTNSEAAAFDFTLRLYFRVKLGAKCADAIFDGATPKETILKPTGLTAHGKPIKPQSKSALRMSYGASDQWGKFVRDLIAIGADIAAELAGDATPTKAKAVQKTDRQSAVDTAGTLIKRMRKAVEKQDGTMLPDVMKRYAAYQEDGLKIFGLK